MTPNEISFLSVAWKDGMLLRAAHLEQLERYIDSGTLWMLRHRFDGEGLVGAGPRLNRINRRAEYLDPEIDFREADNVLSVSVRGCRGITSGGYVIDVPRDQPLREQFEAEDVPTSNSILIYIVCEPFEKRPYKDVDAEPYESLPKPIDLRQPKYSLKFNLSDEDQDAALAVARLIRTNGNFQQDPHYIPPCLFMCSHGRLAAKHKEFVGELQLLLNRFLELHRAMRSAFRVLKRSSEEMLLGVDDLTFAGRMIVAIENCLQEIAVPAVSPAQFILAFRSLFRSSSLYVSVSSDIQDYLEKLEEHLGIDYEKPIVAGERKQLDVWRSQDDLAEELGRIELILNQLKEFELSIEAKYIDHRMNLRLREVPFLIDGDAVYLRVKSARVYQGAGDIQQLNFDFDPDETLRGGSDDYRLVLAVGRDTDPAPAEDFRAYLYINASDKKQEIVPAKPRQFQKNYDFDRLEFREGIDVNRLTVRFRSGLGIVEGFIYHRRYLERERPPEEFEPLNFVKEDSDRSRPRTRSSSTSGIRVPSWEMASERKSRPESKQEGDYRSKYAEPEELNREEKKDRQRFSAHESGNREGRSRREDRRSPPDRDFLSDD